MASVACAEDWRTYPERGQQPYLGLDDTSAPTQVQDGRAQDLQNVKLGISKDAQARHGYSLIGDTLDIGAAESSDGQDEDFCTVTGLYYTKFSSGTERIIGTCGNRFMYLNGTSWDQVSGITVAITAGQNNQFVWATALDEILGTNDVNPPIRYNGTALDVIDFSSLSSDQRVTQAKTIAFFKNFAIVANTVEGGVSYPTRFRWSDIGTLAFSDDNYVDIDALGGQEINAMAELYDNLYVFLTDSIYRVSFVAGADTFQFSKVTENIGSIAKNSVQPLTLSNNQNGLIFLDKRKDIYFFNGIAATTVSDLISVTMDGLSASRLQYAVSADSGTDYYLCLTSGSGGTNNLCLDLQYQIGEWSKYTGIPANAMAHVIDANGRDQVYFGTDNSFVYQLEDDDLDSDVGSAFGTVASVSTYDTSNASGLQVLYVSGAAYTVNSLTGAPIELTSNTTSTGIVSTIAYNTATGLVVTDSYGADVTGNLTTFEVGAIDSFYTTKWYDLGESARNKRWGELYFWGAEGEASGITISFATDLSADILTQTISLDAATTDAIWGSAIWGTSRWGSSSDIFRQVKLESEGRYARIKWAEDDPDEDWHLYGWNFLYAPADLN